MQNHHSNKSFLHRIKWHWLLLSLAVILLDQITKAWAVHSLEMFSSTPVLPFFNLTLLYNTGAAFSFLQDAGGWQQWFFIGLGTLISILIISWIHRTDIKKWTLIALSLILGGAIGNLIDRALYGYVIDFLDFYINHWHWPAFNIADSAICIGALMLIRDIFTK